MPSHAELLDIHIGDKTMKKMITIVQVISLCAVTLFLTACSSYNTHSSDEAMQESKYQEGYLATEEATIETTIPIIAQAEDVDNSLSEKEYWSCVDEEILGIFKNNDLYVIRVDTGAPYMNYHVEFGVLNSDGTYTANDTRSTLKKLSDGTFVLTNKNQDIYSFNSKAKYSLSNA